jgi:PAS domain S-box-containing protein
MTDNEPKTIEDLTKKIQRLKDLLQEREDRLQEANDTLEAIRTGAVDGIVRSTPEGEQVFILKGSDQPYRNLIEEMNEGALLISDTGIILYCNIGFAELVGRKIDKVIGTPLSDWVSARNVEVLNDIIAGNKKDGRRIFEIAFQNVKKQLIPTHVSISTIAFGSINAFALIVTDLSKHMEKEINQYTQNLEKEITQRKKAEELLKASEEHAKKQVVELKRLQGQLEVKNAEVEQYATRMESLAEERAKKLQDAERLAAIGATAGMVGHDIRNPLQAISGDIYLLNDSLVDLPDNRQKSEMKESIESITTNVSYINKIVADLQDFARPLKPEYSIFDLPKLINETLTTIILPDNVKLSVNAETMRAIKSDQIYLRRSITNLVNNAIQAMPNGGKLEVRCFSKDGSVFVTVSDTGVGIPGHVKDKLFTPMMTTKSKGQGLGLAVVKRLIEALNGTISFESEEGKGTKFMIELPINNGKKSPRIY